MSQTDTGVDQQFSLGKQMKMAREDRGDSLLSAAQALKLPASVIESMENDQFDRLGASVYARGHVKAYLRWLGLPESAAQQLEYVEASTPVLQPSVRTSRSKVWVERNAMRAVYAVLTASIILPALWVANERSGLDAWRAGRSLDELSAPSAVPPASDATRAVQLPASNDVSEKPVDSQGDAPMPVMASMTPFSSKASEVKTTDAEEANAGAALDTGWKFEFVGDSWVEIEGPDGRLEYGMLRQGETREFSASEVSRVSLGNVHAVKLSFAGEPVALDAVTRANVARFNVSSAGEISGDSR